MKLVVYTAIAGGYDQLKPPAVRPSNCDLVCFTDDPTRRAAGWTLRPLPDAADTTDATMRAKTPKIRPHLYLANYDASVWIDASFCIIDDVAQLARRLLSKSSIAVFRHREGRQSVAAEGKAIVERGRASAEAVQAQLQEYAAAGFIDDQPIPQCGVLVRRHHDPTVVAAMDHWWRELVAHTPRDQLSFRYACSKAGLDYRLVSYKILKTYLHQYGHGQPFDAPPERPALWTPAGLKRWVRKRLV